MEFEVKRKKDKTIQQIFKIDQFSDLLYHGLAVSSGRVQYLIRGS